MRAALLPLLLAACTSSPQTELAAPGPESWAIEAEMVESCCCDPICPCLVGSTPTRGHCLGHRLVVIERGHYHGVDLDGVSLVLTFSIGKWSKIWVDDKATEEQVAAVRSLLDNLQGFPLGEVRALERVPLSIERGETTFAYSTPQATVELEVVTGFGDRPIEIENLRSFRDYVQYRSTTLAHTADDDTAFEFSGTNGFHCRYRASS